MLLSSITSSASKISSSCMSSTPSDMSSRSNSSMLPPPPSSSSWTRSSSSSASYPLLGQSCYNHLQNFVYLAVAICYELNIMAVSVSILCLPNWARERLWARLAALWLCSPPLAPFRVESMIDLKSHTCSKPTTPLRTPTDYCVLHYGQEQEQLLRAPWRTFYYTIIQGMAWKCWIKHWYNTAIINPHL